jgi:hypothetical protein
VPNVQHPQAPVRRVPGARRARGDPQAVSPFVSIIKEMGCSKPHANSKKNADPESAFCCMGCDFVGQEERGLVMSP